MFPVKREPSDTFDVGKDSQHSRCIDDHPHINDTLNTDTSDNRPHKSLSDDMLLTVAYVKNESTSHVFNYSTSNSKGNECIDGEQLTDINIIKTDKTEVCSDNTSGEVIDDDNETMHVKEEPQYYHIKEHVTDISQHDCVKGEGHNTMHDKVELKHFLIIEHKFDNVTDISQNYKVGKSDAIDIGDMIICPSSATLSRYETQKRINKRGHSGENSTTTSGALKKQKMIHVGVKPYKCDLFDYSTIHSGDLKNHKLIHSREKPYKCDVCDYSTTQYGALKTHKLILTGERPYKCDLCDYSTTQYGALNTHKLIHSGERPYKCDLCDYSTTQYDALKTHKLIHSGERPYKCDLCDYSTTQYGALKTHKLIHSGERPYKLGVTMLVFYKN